MSTDTVRSRTMRAVKSKDTKPEVVIRRLVHALGFRFRLHRVDLPGSPDLVFSKKRKIIFVHGCFWHGHSCARGARQPKTNTEYWLRKIEGNRRRDKQSLAELRRLGWNILVLWECQLKEPKKTRSRVKKFLDS